MNRFNIYYLLKVKENQAFLEHANSLTFAFLQVATVVIAGFAIHIFSMNVLGSHMLPKRNC